MPLRFMFGLQANGFVILQPGVICQLFLPRRPKLFDLLQFGARSPSRLAFAQIKTAGHSVGPQSCVLQVGSKLQQIEKFFWARLLVASPVANVLVFRSAREAVSYNGVRILPGVWSVRCAPLRHGEGIIGSEVLWGPNEICSVCWMSWGVYPGIGPKSAQRIAYHLLECDPQEARRLADAIIDVKEHVHFCSRCFNYATADECPICQDGTRDRTRICVVGEPRDVTAIERTGSYHGLYHVLGGVISPMDKIGPDQLHVRELLARLGSETSKRSSSPPTPILKGRPRRAIWPVPSSRWVLRVTASSERSARGRRP